MSNTYTPNVAMAMPACGDRTWNVALNGNCATLDALAPVGSLCVTTTETPSASLNVHVAAGSFVNQDGTIAIFPRAVSQAITASATRALYLDGTASWALTVAPSYPTTPHVRLATVVTGSSTITSIVDNRQCFTVCGTIGDGINLTLGTSTGTRIGTSSSQKLGFFGATPVIQQTMGVATASGSWTSNEQNMLQTVWNVLRTLGLGN
jgi:hypothetical protein